MRAHPIAVLALRPPIVAACLLLLSRPTAAGDDDEPGTKRVCDDATFARLKEAKIHACKRNGPMGCKGDMSCVELSERLVAINKCIAAREAEMVQCFQGGDSGHKIQVRQLQSAAENCWHFFNKNCKKNDESCRE